MGISVATTFEERLQDLENIPACRIRTNPAPGTATIEDVTYFKDTEQRLYELIDGYLVEKSNGLARITTSGCIVAWSRSPI